MRCSRVTISGCRTVGPETEAAAFGGSRRAETASDSSNRLASLSLGSSELSAHRLATGDALRVQAALRIHKLAEPQWAKLRIAGKGDIKRFFDHVDDKRVFFEIDRMSLKTGRGALRRLEPLSDVYDEGPFGDGSLFAKTLRRIQDERATAN
jgi:hypothetical protein